MRNSIQVQRMNAWIFQGNLDRFDVDAKISQNTKIYWTVSVKSYCDEMVVGDRAFLWRAKGSRSSVSGLVAIGSVIEECRTQSEVLHPEWLGDRLGPEEIKAGIHIDEFRLSIKDGMITRKQVQADEILGSIPIIKSSVGSNFKLKPPEAARLLQLWETAADEDADGFAGRGVSAREGRILKRIHSVRERNRKLVNDAKSAYIRKHGSLFCQLCGFSFADTYGEMGLDFIEAHHIKPVSTIKAGEETRIEDLMMVCANCHRMLHRADPLENLDALRERFGVGDGK